MIKSVNGYINGNFYDFELIAIKLKDDISELHITPYSTLVFDILQTQNLSINKKNIEYCENLIKDALGIRDLNDVSSKFSKYLQEHGINKVIKELAIDIIEQKGDKKLASIFPDSKILQPTVTLKNELPSQSDNSNTFKVITSTGTEEINNTPSLISAIVADKDAKNIYAYSSNIPSLKGKINFDSTAMALIGMPLKERYMIDNLKLQYIYDNIKDTDEYKNLVNSIKEGYENNISLSNNDKVYENLKKVFYYIDKNGLLNNKKNNNGSDSDVLSIKTIKKINASKILLKTRSNIEVFPYPFFKFNFKDASVVNYNGNVEFSIENPAFTGYSFATKNIYFSEMNGFLDVLVSKSGNLYIPFAKLYKSEDYIRDISRTYSDAYVNYIITGELDVNNNSPIKTLGKSEDTVYTLSPYNCGENEKCWKGKFIAYNNGPIPKIYNASYFLIDVFGTISGLKIFKEQKEYVKFVKFLISFKDKYKLSEFKSMLVSVRYSLDTLYTMFFYELSDGLNIPQLYSAYKQIQSQVKEIQRIIHTIDIVLTKLEGDIPEYNPNPVSIENKYVEDIFKAFSKGNFFKAVEIAQQNNEKISDVFSLYINYLIFPDVNYKGTLYSSKAFLANKKISKSDKALVLMAVMSKFLFPDDKKDPYKTINKILASKMITIEWKKLDKGISPAESLTNMLSIVDKIVNFVASWSNRGFYVDYDEIKQSINNLGTLFLQWVKGYATDLLTNAEKDILDAYFTTRQVGKKALVALDAASEGIQLNLMIGSYYANPNVLPRLSPNLVSPFFLYQNFFYCPTSFLSLSSS